VLLSNTTFITVAVFARFVSDTRASCLIDVEVVATEADVSVSWQVTSEPRYDASHVNSTCMFGYFVAINLALGSL